MAPSSAATILKPSSGTNILSAFINSSSAAKSTTTAAAATAPATTAAAPAAAATSTITTASISPFRELGPSQIAVPTTPTSTTNGSGTQLPPRFIGDLPFPIWRRGPQAYAPAWFYSALNWLGQTYYDASNVGQEFATYMVGSDVDPYSKLGSTRLFAISMYSSSFLLTLAADSDSLALQTSNDNTYPNTDAGILQMYTALAASATFASVTHVYIPALLDPRDRDEDANISTGYDPATGLRVCVLGSAVAQVVPLGDFANTYNEQIYDPTPTIVPIVPAALVYDVTQNNSVGARTFTLPTYYTRDQVSQGNYYVSKLGSTTPGGEDFGQTVVFPSGPGYVAAGATALQLKGTASTSAGGPVGASARDIFTTYTFSTATVVTTRPPSLPLSPEVQLGVTSLTCTASPLSVAFSNQAIVGFYRPSSWTSCLGIPMWDFGSSNSSFTLTTTTLLSPSLIYDPTTPFLNGGSLQKVVGSLQNAKYLYSPDRVVEMLERAISAGSREGESGVGLSVTTAALGFQPTTPPAGPVLDSLAVPVSVTVTTTPPLIYIPRHIDSDAAAAARASSSASSEPSSNGKRPILTPTASTGGSSSRISHSAANKMVETRSDALIGAGGNAPRITQFSPTIIQAGLTASIPQEALTGTGIISIESGTAFATQSLGSGATFEALGTAGTVLNLTSSKALPPVDLTVATIGTGLFNEGIFYVLSLTGSALTLRGSDASSVSEEVSIGQSKPDPNHTYVGAVVYNSSVTSITLYPKLQLTLAAPAVGTYDILQGKRYSVRLTLGDGTDRLDIVDDTQAVVASNIIVKTPTPTDGSSPQRGDVYFGSFLGGASQMTVWEVPIFLSVAAGQLPGASFNGGMTLSAQADGVPSYQLQLTDSSLFVYSNINVDRDSVGSVSANNVYLASAVINSAPDDVASPAAFAPCKLLMGLVRKAPMGTQSPYVFIPEDDSVLIGSTRYMLSVINLTNFDLDLTTRPYIPVYWTDSQYWQFANRHNPYLGVGYAGPATQAERINKAQADVASIGLATATAGEPMHMYLDTVSGGMVVWPIWQFPYVNESQSVDQNQLKTITSTILSILSTSFPPARSFVPGPLDADRITVPGELSLNNPYSVSTATTSPPPTTTTTTTTLAVEQDVVEPSPIVGLQVTNVNASGGSGTSAPQSLATHQSIMVQQQQQTAASLAAVKNLAPVLEVTQAHTLNELIDLPPQKLFRQFNFPPIYGFSVFNPGTGEAYIIELVDADSGAPQQYPINSPGNGPSYDPYYVRVVFLNTLTAYNMSIIVPSMVHDQYGHFATQETEYTNLRSKTDELGLGYMYSLYDTSNNFDTITLRPYPPVLAGFSRLLAASQSKVFTNVPYTTEQLAIFSPIYLFDKVSTTFSSSTQTEHATEKSFEKILFNPSQIQFIRFPTPPIYFVCRRQNWSDQCHLMQATQPAGKSIYLGFGGGDIVPFQLDAAFKVVNTFPGHLLKLTYLFSDKDYASAKTISVANTPYVVAVTSTASVPTQYMNFSLQPAVGTTDVQMSTNQALQFPTDILVVGQASTTLTSMASINTSLKTSFTDTGNFMSLNDDGTVMADQQFQLIPYNNLVYLVRAVSNIKALGLVGNLGVVSGLLIDTYVPNTTGNLSLAQGARYKRSGLSFFGSSYTPTTMVDTLDTLDFTSITGTTFYAPTIFVPIAEIDAAKGFVADISNFLGQQAWTFIYPEIVALPGTMVNSVAYGDGYSIDGYKKPILSLQRLHFVYDPLVVLFTPNDLTHKYRLQPKQQILALTNGQVQEAICWRSANVQPERQPPTNISAQQILPADQYMDRPNVIYSPQNRPLITSISTSYMGMSVNSFRGVSGVVYNIEESALQTDQTATKFISQVSSTANMLVAVLFDYDNNDLGTLTPYSSDGSTKGIVFLNGYLSLSGYAFSSPDHFDIGDILPCNVPLLDQVANTLGFDAAFYNTDVSLPQQFWSLTYDTFTASGVPNYISNVPPSAVDPNFTNRTRSLILSLQNSVLPQELGLIDTYSSVVSANLHLANGITGSIFLSKKADRNVSSAGSFPGGSSPFGPSHRLHGLPNNYDFFLFSRDHYGTLDGASFQLIDQGYAMCLVDDGTGTGTKVASYYIDSDGNYYELYSYVAYSPNGGVIESLTFTMKIILGSPANLGVTPSIPETPNNVNPQTLVSVLNAGSSLVYAVLGPSTPGQAPAYLPIQSVAGAAPILGPPGFNGYSLNVVSTNRQPLQISQIYSGGVSYPIAGSTTIRPLDTVTGGTLNFYGSLSHGLDQLVTLTGLLYSADMTSWIPRPAGSTVSSYGTFGGNGLGALISTPLSCAFQGSAPIPPATSTDQNPAPGSIMQGDDYNFYTFNAVMDTVVDSNGYLYGVTGGQYFVDATAANPIYVAITLPYFILNQETYNFSLSTTLSDGVTSRYSLVVGGKSYLFNAGNTSVTVDRTTFTFSPKSATNIYTVTRTSLDAPTSVVGPTPVELFPFTIAAGGMVKTLDVFNNPPALNDILLGVTGHSYTYNPVNGTVAITQNGTTTTVPLSTGLTFIPNSGYGYAIGYSNNTYTVNGYPVYPYSAQTQAPPASLPLMTSPQMFTLDGNFYTFDRNPYGGYTSVTGNGQVYPINPYQFSILGVVYIINSNVQPYTVIGGGNTYTMTANNSQFLINGVQYTIAYRQNSLYLATISGQYNISQGNVVILEDYVYQLDTLNGQIIGNGTTYSLTTSGTTYTITALDHSFTVTTQANAITVTISGIVYSIGSSTVVGDGVTYPILKYRGFNDSGTQFVIGPTGVASVPPPISLVGTPPYIRATFTDGPDMYTVYDYAAFDGTNYYVLTGTPSQFTVGTVVYTIRQDAVAITAGVSQTYILNTSDNPNQFSFGAETVTYWNDHAAFDGTHYYAMTDNQFTDSNTGFTYTISGNTAVHEGNSYEVYSNLGQEPYFQVPGGPTYYINLSVADFGNASGDEFHVFPISNGQFTIPVTYTITVAGSTVTINSPTFKSGPATIPTMTASAGVLTGGDFIDPVTEIQYTCEVNGDVITFIDSNNAVFPYPSPNGPANSFVALVTVTVGVDVAVDNEATPAMYPIQYNQFTTGSATYSTSVAIAYTSAATGPYYPIVNGQFIVPMTDPVSNISYTIAGSSVTKGYVINSDDEFSADGNVVYTVNAVNIVKASNQATLVGAEPNQVIISGANLYALNPTASLATAEVPGVNYNTATKRFTINYNGVFVTYTVGSLKVTDNRQKPTQFDLSFNGSQATFKDTISTVTFTFDDSGNNPINAGFVYSNHFFIDLIQDITYYVDETDLTVEVISYIPETTQYAFVAANGQTYLIHYNDVSVVFPVISGPNVNAGVANVGSDIFSVFIDQVNPADGSAAVPVNLNSFEINGDLYTIMGTPTGTNYSSCQVVGARMSPTNFLSANTFKLRDQTVTYTLQLNANNLPSAVVASFRVQPSRDMLNINNNIFLISYNTVSSGSLLGQGSSGIPITSSTFTLYNKYDSTSANFIFADLNIYDAGSVVGQYTSYFAPTFFIGSATYTLDPVKLSVSDNNKAPYPLIRNPIMFSINGYNYVIDTNQTPHSIVGNNNVSPLATDVTVQSGKPVPNSTFTLNGQVYKYTEDAHHGLLTVTGTKSYMIAQPAQTFTLDSSLLFTVSLTPPQNTNYPGSIVPLGTVTAAGGLTCNIYAGLPESGNADFFTYGNNPYTFVKSGTTYVAVQKSYTVYAAQPTTNQQQLAVFDLAGATYIVTTGTTAGSTSPAGINPGTLWAATTPSNSEVGFGVVYGFTKFPIGVFRSQTPPTTGMFQFMVTDANDNTTLYDIIYTAGGNSNVVQVDVPRLIPSFTQVAPFDFVPPFPLTLETGGYNAFTMSVAESNIPYQSFAAAYRTPVTSTDSQVNNISTTQGDFSVEFWNSLPLTSPSAYHPFTYSASNNNSLVYFIDVDFESETEMYVQVNNTVMTTSTTPILFSSTWQHFALTYTQPNTILCQGSGYEVANGTNYDFNSDFSIAMTFSVSDIQTPQGLLYKGTGARKLPASLEMSYSVTVANGTVNLFIQGTSGSPTQFVGPSIRPGAFYELIIVKAAVTGAGSGGTNPYTPPFDIGTQLEAAAKAGAQVKLTNNSDGTTTMTGIQLPSGADPSAPNSFANNLPAPATSYNVYISVRTIGDGGIYGNWTPSKATPMVGGNPTINSTGPAHLLIGAAFDNLGTFQPLGGVTGSSTGNIRKLYLFGSAIDAQGNINQTSIGPSVSTVDISQATSQDLLGSGIVGYWRADYDPNGVVYNAFDDAAIALSMNSGPTKPFAGLAGLTSHELDGAMLYINGYPMNLTLATNPPPSMLPYSPGPPLLNINAGLYRLAEISIWGMARQPYQIIDDMFGRLIPANEPLLIIYLSGSFDLKDVTGPALPMSSYVDQVKTENLGSLGLQLSNASRDLQGCPAVGRCGPLITPNLYTPPGIALTVCDTVPYLTTYSITINSITDPSNLAGVINEAYVYINSGTLTLYAGKKVGDLSLSWVSQEQGDVQLIGYIEGPPPCPMANMTNRPAYPGATSVSLNIPNSVTLKYQTEDDFSQTTKQQWDVGAGVNIGLQLQIAPIGFGMGTGKKTLQLQLQGQDSLYSNSATGKITQQYSTEKLEESHRFTVKMQGTPTLPAGDTFMASLNAQVTPSSTPGNPGARTAILPNPNVGGFTTSNPPSQLPRGPQPDEKFGSRMYQPSPYGQAFVTSETLDVYQQTLLQSNTVYGFVRVPNPQIPRDLNIVSFRMSSKYIRPGCLDGIVGYAYNPATLATGEQTYKTSTGQLQVLYDKNFSEAQAGNEASYMRVAEAYKIKKQIDQQSFNGLGLYQAAYATQEGATDSRLTPALDFYNEYIWSSRGGTQEVKHAYTTSYDEVTTVSSTSGGGKDVVYNAKIACIYVTILDVKFTKQETHSTVNRYSYNTTGSTSFDVSASFDGIETDTQMRYGCDNDAHFVMNLNSTFNPNNQSGLNLVIGSDGLVYNIVPSVSSGAGLPTSDNIDDSQTYMQPPPTYTTGNADGLTGNLEPYDRPGKTNLFRTYQFFLQPTQDNNTTFWETVVDPIWLANSQDADAVALRTAQTANSIPWRLFWRVTYSERFLPPISNEGVVVPQITPVMAIPVQDSATDFLFQAINKEGPRPAQNPANDIGANIVLAAPTASGLSVGFITPQGAPNPGLTVLPNNVIPFDLVASLSSIVNWGDSTNAKLLSMVTRSVLGTNTVPFSPSVASGSTKVVDVKDPVSGAVLYSVFTDPNGITVNVAINSAITVYQDVNANPIQYYDGKSYHSLQADYIASPDGTAMLYIEPPSTYDQTTFDLLGDYDLFGHPGDQWRYYLVSGFSSNLTSTPSVSGSGPFLISSGGAPGAGFAGLTIPTSMHSTAGANQVAGYVLAQGVLQYPSLNTNAETFADVLVYKSLSLLDMYPVGDAEVFVRFLQAQFPGAPFVAGPGASADVQTVLARNVISYFNALQAGAAPS